MHRWALVLATLAPSCSTARSMWLKAMRCASRSTPSARARPTNRRLRRTSAPSCSLLRSRRHLSKTRWSSGNSSNSRATALVARKRWRRLTGPPRSVRHSSPPVARVPRCWWRLATSTAPLLNLIATCASCRRASTRGVGSSTFCSVATPTTAPKRRCAQRLAIRQEKRDGTSLSVTCSPSVAGLPRPRCVMPAPTSFSPTRRLSSVHLTLASALAISAERSRFVVLAVTLFATIQWHAPISVRRSLPSARRATA